ncbi:Gfo/Idh/MocA family protein [Aureimonas jatrophae]|uniref:Predicted dehydrogenase n=1 Tax=Aureimonas jatrophae TaxID=1166073 RepID=A0A1H0C329_9HYPH|nr:Gfo/Idh/MocA family oxidoreductase [Aureimonas jatrophae]MBB3949045.1 putative dehydrogenase [Aureimonas jatrophae]SDN52256.1 Predicted dehydrogenase [Aureimonas jatrophae]
MNELRGALIGCGFFARNQMNAWRDLPGVRIVALCDRDAGRLQAMGEDFGVPARFTDAEAMLRETRPDFVDIATTAPSHRALVELAASLGIPAICQKPFAPTMADARAMVAACERAGVPLMVHENFRWQSPIRRLRAVLDEGTIGTPFFGRVSFRSAFDVYSGQPYLAEGERFIVEDLGIHALDIARFLFGDATAITTRMARVNPLIRGEDVATMLLDHAAGLHSVVDCSYATRLEEELFPQTLVEIDGALGSIRLGPGYRLSVTDAAGTRHEDLSPPLLAWASRPWHNIQESVLLIQRHWLETLRDGREPDTSGRDNLQTLALVEAAYQGARTGLPVALADV